MRESSWQVTVGLNGEADETPRQAFDTFMVDYAAFRKRLNQLDSIKAALVMRHLYTHPLTSADFAAIEG